MFESIADFIFVRLKPDELEERFRIEMLARDKTQTIIVMTLTLITIIGFTAIDIRLLQNNNPLNLSIVSRCLASIASLITIWTVHRLSSARSLDRTTFTWGLIIICHMLTINVVRPTDYIPVIVWDVLTICGIYFILPMPFHLKMFTAMSLTGGGGALWMIYRLPLADEYETLAVLGAYFFANVYGIFTSRRLHQSHRQRYLLLTQEMKSRKELSDRTTELEITQEKLRLLAMTDPLTGTSNRRHFMRRASEELERTKRYGSPLSLMVLDIDNFKVINDTFGHESGDEVLRSIANHCLSYLRSIDQFARLGGDEFVALLVQADQDNAKEIAERLRASVEGMEIRISGEIIDTSVSIGLTTTTDDELSVKELVKRADDALYEAKNRGRNQVAIK